MTQRSWRAFSEFFRASLKLHGISRRRLSKRLRIAWNVYIRFEYTKCGWLIIIQIPIRPHYNFHARRGEKEISFNFHPLIVIYTRNREERNVLPKTTLISRWMKGKWQPNQRPRHEKKCAANDIIIKAIPDVARLKTNLSFVLAMATITSSINT